MPLMTTRHRKSLLYTLLIVWRTKAFWLRAFLCWLVGAAVFMSDENGKFDLRLQIRGPQHSAAPIVLVDINEHDWLENDHDMRNMIRPMKEITGLSDNFFWNAKTWHEILQNLLEADPAAIGVTFYFGDNVRIPMLTEQERSVFENPRIIWGADVDSAGRALVPIFASTYNSNIGIRQLRLDDDGIVRRFSSSLVQIPNMAARLADVARPQNINKNSYNWLNPVMINYAGGSESFETLTLRDILAKSFNPQNLKGKIIIFGTHSSVMDVVQTPLGRMSRAEVLANILDNILLKRTVGRFPNGIYLAFLALILLYSVWVLSTYPQSVALVFFIWTSTLWAAISAWIFDSYYFWIPVFSPLIQLGFTYFIFLSYQLAMNEQKTWRLQQKQKYLHEIEELKNNFVSMMSHDLKTPIAKIQAIVDRLLTQNPNHEFALDLKSLRRSSDELHQYIRSILQVTRVEAKDFQVVKEVTDLNENIERVITHLSPLAQEKQIRLELNLEPMFSIEVDKTLIQEVILNLVENAIKYTPSGGCVRVISEEKDDNVFFFVEDTGPGIAPEEQKEIWGKFTRGKNQLDVKGSGLGLYLVKYFVELHGGRVFLQSQLGQGTKFGFSIPVSSDTPNEQLPSPLTNSGTAMNEGAIL